MRVCTPCYEAQLVILKEDTVSTDDDLRSLISEHKASLLSIGNIKSEDVILNQATYSTAVLCRREATVFTLTISQ